MNTPNKLTLLRILLVPVFLLFFLCEGIPLHSVWALVVFALASTTDAMDGHIARSRNLITNFGKFLDPVADKVLVFAALVAFIDFGWASSVAVIIMIAREFLVSSLRMVAADNGTVIAAGKLGKTENCCDNGIHRGGTGAVSRHGIRFTGRIPHRNHQQYSGMGLRCYYGGFRHRISVE